MTSRDILEVLALDVGDRRIGVARANTMARIAESLPVIDVKQSDPFDSLSVLVAKYSPEMIVIGYPRGLDGQNTEQTDKIKSFAEELKQKTSVSLVYFDEAGTTKIAEDRKINLKDLSDEDSIAAGVILEDFLAYYERGGELAYV